MLHAGTVTASPSGRAAMVSNTLFLHSGLQPGFSETSMLLTVANRLLEEKFLLCLPIPNVPISRNVEIRLGTF